MMNYWHKLTKRFAVKVALPHLLLGVMAASFSLSAQIALPNNQQINNIITITAVMASIHDVQSESKTVAQYSISQQSIVKCESVQPLIFSDIYSAKKVRLTPNNGIRAGPQFNFA